MLTDLLGRVIKVGDLLAYPVRTGSTTYLCVIRVDNILHNGVVGNIVADSRDFAGTWGGPSHRTVTRTKRAVIVESTAAINAARAAA
jgi:hypothetical protein